ncbi:MAG: cysteine desulfurase [Deltaproteobacteria bacterium]|nr:cysteine desulfurase [Deltaproteobacteria bacterium]
MASKSSIYLDNAASAPLRVEVLAAMNEAGRAEFANPSSSHGAGRKAAACVDDARQRLLVALGLDDSWRVLFTSGGTEADALAVIGRTALVVDRTRKQAAAPTVVTTVIEHPAVLGCRSILSRMGAHLEIVESDRDGHVPPAALAEAVSPHTAVLSVMHVNNELGTVQDVDSAAKLARLKNPEIMIHSDAVQSLGMLGIDTLASSVDCMSLSAHKIGGPRGVGALVLRRGIELAPLTGGGDQEEGLRPGTENLVGIVGFARAVELCRHDDSGRILGLTERLQSGIERRIDGVQFHGRVLSGHILALSIQGIGSDVLVRALSDRGVYVSSGSACHSTRKSHVAKILGLGPNWGTIRFSLSWQTTQDDVDQALDVLCAVVRDFRV